jgi:lipoyl(octanoyl) transferase
MADLIELIEVMLKQETSLYRTEDYLSPEFQQKLASNSPMEKEDSICALSSSCSSSSSGINESWREKICEWSYQVIDHFDFSREVVSISINLLDRFLAARPVNKKVFQLAAMTSLFIAIKLAAPGKLSMTAMIELSRGYFKADQMAAMEVAILR